MEIKKNTVIERVVNYKSILNLNINLPQNVGNEYRTYGFPPWLAACPMYTYTHSA